jgi:hypothetical protein
MNVPAQARDVHRALTDAMYTYGWGEDFAVHHEFWPEKDSGSIWVTSVDPRELAGFLVDVEADGENQSKIVVYPKDRFFAGRSREWIERTLKIAKVAR